MNDELWKSFIPTYPKSGNLYKRLDMPYIYFKAEKYITNISTLANIKWKNFNREKAIIATVASVLKPGGTNTVSIEDDKWVSKITYQQVEDLSRFVIFLQDSLGIDPII